MTSCVKSSEVSGTLAAPASKSVAQRAIVAALLAKGETTLRGMSLCDDTEAALGVARALGASIEVAGNEYKISSDFFAKNTDKKTIFCGESGLLTRMLTPVVALLEHAITITGCGSLTSRPLDMVEPPLRELGASIDTACGHLPMVVKGALKGGETSIDGGLSSQLLTGLLMALPLAPRDSTIRVSNLKSRPYVDLTIELLHAFGVEVENEGYHTFRIAGRQRYRPCCYEVEGDWSGASCLLVAGAIAGCVRVNNLRTDTLQADRAMLAALELAGAGVSVGSGYVEVSKGKLRAFTFDATHCPDLFPALVALASRCDGVSVVRGVSRLAHKESNRALALQQEFGKLGLGIELRDDEMCICGGELRGSTVCAHHDHRMAMALATAALCAQGEVRVEEAESVGKSYREFWEALQNCSTPPRCG
jgi:3-phosphoshikimate 1-carboxyvinyltransferase